MQSGHPITKQQKLTNTFNSTTILCPSPCRGVPTSNAQWGALEGGDGGGLTTMAKVDYAYPVEALHGKVKKTHTVGFALRKETGCKFTQTFNRSDSAPTEAQTEVQQRFATAVKAARVRMADASKQAQDLAAFRKQSKYKTLYGYVFSVVYAQGA